MPIYFRINKKRESECSVVSVLASVSGPGSISTWIIYRETRFGLSPSDAKAYLSRFDRSTMLKTPNC